VSRTWRDAKFDLLGAAVLCAGIVVVDLILEPRSEVWEEAVGIAGRPTRAACRP
jgi:hypothetical protein